MYYSMQALMLSVALGAVAACPFSNPASRVEGQPCPSTGLRSGRKLFPPHYEPPTPRWNASTTAADKLETLWAQVVADETPHGYMNPLKTALRVGNISYLRTMGEPQGVNGDEREVRSMAAV